MVKGKGKSTSAGPRKTHGPKRKLFHYYDSTTRLALGKAGLLSKYYNYESFCLACAARGKRNVSHKDFNDFQLLDRDQQNEYLKNLNKKA